ncbi:hypothetical protein, partial [Mesorhizobium sp. M7A.F.Ca.US.001.04.2.1]
QFNPVRTHQIPRRVGGKTLKARRVWRVSGRLSDCDSLTALSRSCGDSAALENAGQKPAESKSKALFPGCSIAGANSVFSPGEIADGPPEEDQEDNENAGVDRAMT